MYCGVVIPSWTETCGFPAKGVLKRGVIALIITPQKNSAIGTP
jgi:hypothetical protein